MASQWLVYQYVNLISGQLRNFKKRGESWNFSCPLCGDSPTDKKKARGYVIKDTKAVYYYYCHKCKTSLSFGDLLKAVNTAIHDAYVVDLLRDGTGSKTKPKQTTLAVDTDYSKSKLASLRQVPAAPTDLVSLSSLDSTHPAVMYATQRKLPLQRLWWTDKFKNTCVELCCDDESKKNYNSTLLNEPRLCVLLKDVSGQNIGIVGRSINAATPGKYRYLTIKFNQLALKLFGLELLDKENTTYVVEGALDSMFLPNSLAMCGSHVAIKSLEEVVVKEKTVVILDNEPRKVETIEGLIKYAKAGFSVAVWKGMNPAYKDINAMVLAGFSKEYIKNEIDKNTFSGQRALFEIATWKKRNIKGVL